MLKQYNTLAITILSKCTAKCAMCCFSCTPESTEHLEKSQILSLINDSKNNKNIEKISFTGGEAFLMYDDLCEYVELASNYNKKVTVITNGYWAVNHEIAVQKLKLLKDNGLTSLSVSYDEFHKDYISPQKIKTLLKASKDISLQVTIGMVCNKDVDNADIIKELQPEIFSVPIMTYPCLPTGSAKSLNEDSFYTELPLNKIKNCPHGGIVSVLFNKKAYPCCSQSVIDTELSIGDIENDNLDIIYKNLKSNAVLYLLRNEGFEWFINIIKENNLFSLDEFYVSECHLCSQIFSKEKIEIMLPYIRKYFENFKK